MGVSLQEQGVEMTGHLGDWFLKLDSLVQEVDEARLNARFKPKEGGK